MSRQERYRDTYKKLRPDWNDSLSIYRDLIAKECGPKTRILDVGCGHGEFLRPIYEDMPNTYGIDPDEDALKKNKLIKHLKVASVEDLPFKDNFFDVVVMEWVVEHLPDPQAAFGEIHRVLKPNGKVIFVTPNARSYVAWMIRAVPNRFHDFFTTRLYGRHSGDTYPVQYKANSPKNLARRVEPIGFQKVQLIFNGDPSYISFNEPLFLIARALEKLTDIPQLNYSRVHLIGVYQKAARKI